MWVAVYRSADVQVLDVGGGAGDAAVLAGVAELAAEARRAGLHRADQRGPAALARHEGPHRARGQRGRVHPQPDARRRRAQARRLRGARRHFSSTF